MPNVIIPKELETSTTLTINIPQGLDTVNIPTGLELTKPQKRKQIFKYERQPVSPQVEQIEKKYTPKSFWQSVINLLTPETIKGQRTLQELKKIPTEERQAFLGNIIGKQMEQQIGVAEIPPRFVYGVTKGRTFGAPELVANLAGFEVPEAMTPAGEVVEKFGELVGLWGALSWLRTKPPFKIFGKLKPTTWWGTGIARAGKGAALLGTYGFLSEHGGATFMENVQRRVRAGGESAKIGAIFAAISSVAVKPKYAAGEVINKWALTTAFATRLAANEYVIGVPALKAHLEGRLSLPSALYEVGLGLMFSLSNSPLKLEAEFNKGIKQQYKLKNLTKESLVKEIEKIGDYNKVPTDMKWAYIMKVTQGKVKPTYQNAGDYLENEYLRYRNPAQFDMRLKNGQVKTNVGATNHIFEQTLIMNDPLTADKLSFVRELGVDIEAAVTETYAKRVEPGKPKIKEFKIEELKGKRPAIAIDDKDFWEAIKYTPGTKIIDAGIEISVNRFQRKEAEGRPPVTSGIYYYPQRGTVEGRSYKGIGLYGLGGPSRVSGTITVKNPLVIGDAGATLLGVYTLNKLIGEEKATKLRTKIRSKIGDKIEYEYQHGIRQKWEKNKRKLILSITDIKNFLDKYGGDSRASAQILRWLRRPDVAYTSIGSTDRIITENIAFNIARKRGYDAIIGYTTIDYKTPRLDNLVDLRTSVYPIATTKLNIKSIDVPITIAYSIEGVVPPDIKAQEKNVATELATGKEIGVFKRTARAMGLLYKSKTDKDVRSNLNRFLSAYYNITSKDLGTLTKEQIEEARQYMKQMTINPVTGRVTIPKTQEILPMDIFYDLKKRANMFDWLQSGRIAIKPVYDVFKPAYQNYIATRRTQLLRLNEIYKGRVKQGSKIDQDLAKYADGKINLDDLPKEYQDIAIARKKFYDDYADELLEKGLIKRDKVYDSKTGERKPYYHRIFDNVLSEKLFAEGFALEDLWLPGQLPIAGALRKRMGAWGYKYSAVESDLRYIYGIEKYINLVDANKVAIAYAKQMTGTRRKMANTYIRFMRGQPTGTDKTIKEALESSVRMVGRLARGIGAEDIANKFENWNAPSYPIARLSSPLARFYYWRYVGLALDTAFKNSLQWEHALARYGYDNVSWAWYKQFTPEGKKIIAESGILQEGIQRSGHFIQEAARTIDLSKAEEASYWLWAKFDYNNRAVSGLAGYKDAINKGMMHQQALKEAYKASHETQYGYTKADSLLVDMATPLSRFILFKKFPLSKVEMIRQWVRDGHTDAVFNLAMQEYVIYRAAQSVGVDMGNVFNSTWQLATRGLANPGDLVPFVSEIYSIAKMFSNAPDADKHKDRVIRAWQGLGNRWLGKVVDLWKRWQNDWEVRDTQGKLRYQSTPREELTRLLVTPLEATKRQIKQKRMLELDARIGILRKKIIRETLAGNTERAAKIEEEMLLRYGDEFAEEYGKALQPVTPDDIKAYLLEAELPTTERIRRRMPGKGMIKVPKGMEFNPENVPATREPLRTIRGY